MSDEQNPLEEAFKIIDDLPKPTRKRRTRKMPELWAVVTMPDGSKQAYTFTTKAIQVAGEAGVRQVELCRLSPKARGFKVVSTLEV